MHIAPIIGKVVLGVFIAKTVVGAVILGGILAHRAASSRDGSK